MCSSFHSSSHLLTWYCAEQRRAMGSSESVGKHVEIQELARSLGSGTALLIAANTQKN